MGYSNHGWSQSRRARRVDFIGDWIGAISKSHAKYTRDEFALFCSPALRVTGMRYEINAIASTRIVQIVLGSRPMKRSLDQVAPQHRGLGLATIMNRGLAEKYGVPYVHLAAFAIDVDRVCGAITDQNPLLPEAFEIYLALLWIEEFVQTSALSKSEVCEMLEEICVSIFEGNSEAYGTQITFALWVGCEQARLPLELVPLFSSWKKKPTEVLRYVTALGEIKNSRASIAKACLTVAVDPPLAPPTVSKLQEWSAEVS